MLIQDIMASKVVTVGMDIRLTEVKHIFDHVSFHHLVVLDEEQLVVGLITKSDLWSALSPYLGKAAESQRDSETLSQRVHHVMTRSPTCVAPDVSIQQAGTLLLDNKVSCLPVLDSQQQLIGIVTWRDLLSHLLQS